MNHALGRPTQISAQEQDGLMSHFWTPIAAGVQEGTSLNPRYLAVAACFEDGKSIAGIYVDGQDGGGIELGCLLLADRSLASWMAGCRFTPSLCVADRNHVDSILPDGLS